MIVTVRLRGGVRRLPGAHPRPAGHRAGQVDYLSCVAYLQEADVRGRLPRGPAAGWTAPTHRLRAGARRRSGGSACSPTTTSSSAWSAGGRGRRRPARRSTSTRTPSRARTPRPTNSLGATSWQTWSDAGGDHAFSTELDVRSAGRRRPCWSTARRRSPTRRPLIGLLTLDPVVERRLGQRLRHRRALSARRLSRRSSPSSVSSSRLRTPSSHCWQTVARCSPRSQSASDSSRVVPPASSRRTVSTSSSRAAS